MVDNTPEKGTILLVDDLPDNLYVYSEILGRAGFRVITAGNGREALEKLEKLGDSIDLVLSDVMMPGINGFDLCCKIKKESGYSDLPVVLITAQLMDEESAIKGFTYGADDYISRPINPSLLVKKIEGFIEKKESLYRWKATKARSEQELATTEWHTRMLIHDLRSPLSSAMGFLSLLAMDPDLTERQRDLVITIQAAIQRETELIEDMLAMLAARDGKLELLREPFDLVSTISEAVMLQKGNAIRKGVTLEVYPYAERLFVNADRKLIGRVVTNLLDNAVKFSPSNASVEIFAYDKGGGGPPFDEMIDAVEETVIFAVSNTGEPIPGEAHRRIFRPFEQASSGRDRQTKARGAGLGLAFCYEIVRLHNGRIGVVSPIPGRDEGSVFYFALPMYQGTPS